MTDPLVAEMMVAWSVAFVFLALSSWFALRVDALRRALAVSAESLRWHEAQLDRTIAALDEARARRRDDAALVGRVYGDLGDERVAHGKTLAELVDRRVELAEHETRLYSDEFRDALAVDVAKRISVTLDKRVSELVDDDDDLPPTPATSGDLVDDQGRVRIRDVREWIARRNAEKAAIEDDDDDGVLPPSPADLAKIESVPDIGARPPVRGPWVCPKCGGRDDCVESRARGCCAWCARESG